MTHRHMIKYCTLRVHILHVWALKWLKKCRKLCCVEKLRASPQHLNQLPSDIVMQTMYNVVNII